MVANQLRIFTPVGTAMNMVDSENAVTDNGPIPDTNMWCAHTPQPMKPIAMPDPTMNEYPKIGLRLKVGMISETMPKAGNTSTYTSGCPKIQNRCCHRSGSAPASTWKKLAPKRRSNVSRKSATVMTGIAKSSRNCVTSNIHVSTGMRMRLMPLVRMLSTVVIRLMAPTSDAMPVICKPRA